MNILITGGTGFIGSRLALRCKQNGDVVTVLGRENTPAEIQNKDVLHQEGIKVSLTGVDDKQSINNLLRGIDIVFHLAAAQHEMNIPDKVFWDVNVAGTRNLLDASVQNGVKRFVHGSTIGVYGVLDGKIDENSPCNPDNIYGKTKLEGEKLVLSYKEKLPVTVVRIPETYGPGDRRLLKLFKAVQKKVFGLIGKGQNLHHLIYVEDLVDGFLLAANNGNAVGKLFLLSGEKPITTDEMVRTVANSIGGSFPKFRFPLAPLWVIATIIESIFRPLGIQPPIHRRRMDFFRKSFTLVNEKAVKEIGFKPKISFEQGAKLTAEWYKQHGLLS
jgi:nucleoside-diphosphate-sugar epimerase